MGNLDDPVNDMIRRRIRMIRQKKKLSIRQAALLSEIPESSFSCMENGFYRITLFNLKKMLDGMGVGIEEVWPQAPAASVLSKPALDKVNYFRFHEIYMLSDARQAALLRGTDSLQSVYSINITDEDQQDLEELIETDLTRGWTILQKKANGVQVCLCLKDAVIPDHVKRLIAIYMDLWLATSFADSNRNGNGRPHARIS